jgi:hypothetical protein
MSASDLSSVAQNGNPDKVQTVVFGWSMVETQIDWLTNRMRRTRHTRPFLRAVKDKRLLRTGHGHI